MVLPRDTEAAEPTAAALGETDGVAEAAGDDPEAEEAGWDEEDWESDTSSLMGQDIDEVIGADSDDDPPMSTSEVPPPFPEVEASEAPPEAPPERTPEDEPAAQATQPAISGQRVYFVDDAEAQFELGRPLHLIMTGWMVNGEVVCGNHSEADLILPESRIVESQVFQPTDYFKLKLRGRKGQLDILAPSELLIDEDDPHEAVYEKPEDHIIDVIRRDDAGEEDFAIRLQIESDRKLPDPRARLVNIDFEDPLAAALITRGLPRGKPRTLELGALTATFTYDGSKVVITDYLESYQRGEDGYHPFFVQHGTGRFKTAPEDGANIELESGDRMVIGIAVYTLLEE